MSLSNTRGATGTDGSGAVGASPPPQASAVESSVASSQDPRRMESSARSREGMRAATTGVSIEVRVRTRGSFIGGAACRTGAVLPSLTDAEDRRSAANIPERTATAGLAPLGPALSSLRTDRTRGAILSGIAHRAAEHPSRRGRGSYSMSPFLFHRRPACRRIFHVREEGDDDDGRRRDADRDEGVGAASRAGALVRRARGGAHARTRARAPRPAGGARPARTRRGGAGRGLRHGIAGPRGKAAGRRNGHGRRSGRLAGDDRAGGAQGGARRHRGDVPECLRRTASVSRWDVRRGARDVDAPPPARDAATRVRARGAARAEARWTHARGGLLEAVAETGWAARPLAPPRRRAARRHGRAPPRRGVTRGGDGLRRRE